MLLSAGAVALSPVNPMLTQGLVPAALGDTTPAFADTSFPSSAGVALVDHYATYASLYRAQIWVMILVNKLASGTARVPLVVSELQTATGDMSQVSTTAGDSAGSSGATAYASLLAEPNPLHDSFFLKLWTAATWAIYGEALWRKFRNPDGSVAQVWPLHPTIVTAQRNNAGELGYYIATTGSLPSASGQWLPAADVVHFRDYNPDTTARGMSRLEPLRSTLQNEDAARRASAAFWRNGARPSLMLATDSKLSEPAIRRLQAQAANTYAGPDNFGRVAVFEEGLKPQVLSLTAEESQYIQTRALNRDEVCAAFDVPPPAVHILDRATFSNITEQMRSLYRDTMAPKLMAFESVLEAQLRPDFGGPTMRASFDLSSVLAGAPEQQAAQLAQEIQTGQTTPAEARKRTGKPFIAGSDRLLVNSALIPLGVVEETSHGTGTDVIEKPQSIKSTAEQAVYDRLAEDGLVLPGGVIDPHLVAVVDGMRSTQEDA